MTKQIVFFDVAKYISHMGKHYTKCILVILFMVLGSQTAFSQVKKPFQVRYEADIRGELTFIANNIVNRYEEERTVTGWRYRNGRWRYETYTIPGVSPNEPYNDTGNSSSANDSFDMRYIDVDNDNSTFSSSSATLTVPDYNCALVRYAGLYWSAVYTDADRSSIDDIKFKLPGGAYQDITADEIIYDGYGDTDFGYYSPYAAYKDVTSLVAGLANPNGEYFVANVTATTSSNISGGISGGWKMVIVYEDPTLPGDKFITTFDGYAGIKSGESVDIPISGFTTLPAPFPVYASMGVAALEGDNRIPNDGLEINANGSFTTLSNGENPANNFFNSSITIDDAQFTARNPNSVNTLGWDVDYFEIPNGGVNNTVIPNGATSAILRASSSQDKYDIFFTSFDVDIIAPNILLEKRVQTPGGVDITGQGVNLGQTLDYVLTFENIGNDDAINYTIRDVLPVNVSPPNGRSFFNASDFSLPNGVTYTYDPLNREIIFSVPDRYVEDEDADYSIRFRVQVADNCYDFIDACSDLIENVAYGTYRGENNSIQVTDDPSVNGFNTCGFAVPGATNFLLDDLSTCSFDRTIELCGASTVLNAGDGFDSYVWYRDTNANGVIDATDVEINDGDPDNDASTLVVTTVGTYIVDKIVADPCKGFQEVITVEPFGSGGLPNPVTEYFNEVNSDTDPSNDIPGEIVFCSIDNSFIPKIFLCGINDSQPLAVNIVDAQSVTWEILDEGSCTAVGEDCANKALTCSWTEVGTGSNFLLNAPGEYRLSVVYQNGCTSRFYFKGFQNNLDIDFNNRDIVCDTDGNITITNLGNGYAYQLIDNETNNIVVPFSASNGPSFDFATGENGSYRVEVTQLDTNGDPIQDACIFTTPVIGVLDRDVTYNVNLTPETCFNLGSINLQVGNADGPYEYEIRRDDGTNGGLGTLVDSENGQIDNNFTFTDVSAGNYIAIIRTDDGCSYSENVTVINENDLTLSASVSQHITCEDGTILMDAEGGNPSYTYAIWTYVDEGGATVISYPTYADIPATNFQTSTTFSVSNAGEYTFVVLDRNGCYVESNTVLIEFNPAADFNPTTVVDVSCFGDSNGRIQYNVANNNGYTLAFSLFDSDDQPLGSNSSGNFTNLEAGDYRVEINQTLGTASCVSIENITISEPAAEISGDAVLIKDADCISNGSIEAQNVTGGTAPYSYSIDGVNFVGPGAGSETFSGLLKGDYEITIRDANGCTFETDKVKVDEAKELKNLHDRYIIDASCPSETGELKVHMHEGGTKPYNFEIVSPVLIPATLIDDEEAVWENLPAGTHIVRVTDASGCTIENSFTIEPVLKITVVGQLINNVSCVGGSDGEILLNIDDFEKKYAYSINGVEIEDKEDEDQISLDNLSAGDYTISVTDNETDCTVETTITVSEPTTPLSLSNVMVTQPSCLTDGSVSITASGGWGAYGYVLNNPDSSSFGNNTSGNFSGLIQSGTYNGTITDANNCSIPFTFDINPATPPVLVITPNQECFEDATLLTLTANVISGGDGNFEYSLNGGPFGGTNVFSGLPSGTYTIDVRDGKNCTDSESIVIDPELTVTASASSITACATDTDIDIVAAGGDGTYVYAALLDGDTPNASDFATNSTVTVTGPGDYVVYVRDHNGSADYCESTYNITIDKDAPMALSISNTPVFCSGENQSSLTITATGGEAPYTYSIDNGTNYQVGNTFTNVGAGSYNVRVRDVNHCDITQIYTITEPFTLSASATVTSLVECNPTLGAEVRITNAHGGTAPYTYSFDGGGSYASSPIGYLLPGNHTVYIKDSNDCLFPMDVIIEPEPTPPTLSASIDYECDGEGTVTITPNGGAYTYTSFRINGTENTPATNNVFNNVAVGVQSFEVDYISTTPPAPSILLTEDFGVGQPTSITEIDPLFCYEPQDGSPSSCPSFGTDTHIQDGEYSVANTIINPYNWLVPNEQSGVANGRYLAINIGGVAGANGIVYAKRDIEVIPNRDITISLDLFNLKYVGSSGADANLDIQLVNSSGVVITNLVTGEVPKSTDPDIWENYILTLNPGAETNLDIVIRTIGTATAGNDVVIDNILAYQSPEQCPRTASIDVIVEDGYTFEATMLSYEDLDCNADNTGSITFEVENYGAGGFEYSLDNFGSVLGSTTVSPQTIPGLSAGNYTVYVRDAASSLPGCTVSFTQTISEPTVVIADANITQPYTCNNSGAVITASATGGTPGYEYQLEDNAGGIIAPYQTSAVFNGVSAGTYRVRAMDTNGCSDIIDAPIVITAPGLPVFTLQETTCYSGSNDATILVDVTAGNGDYQFRMNGGSWVIPTPTNATSYTFTGLSSGTYTIEVTDAYGCDAVAQTVTIEQQITVSASASSITACGTDSEINITAAGGDGNYVYAVVSDGATPLAGDYSTTNPVTITGTGDYDVYVLDNNGAAGACPAMVDITIVQDAPVAAVPTVVDVTCFGGNNGSISLAPSGGEAPYTYSIDGGTTFGSVNTFNNLTAGTYDVRVRDVNNCEVTIAVPVGELPELVAESVQTEDYTCNQLGEISVGSITPTTGGSNSYQYNLNGGAWTAATAGGTVFANLTDGTYTIQVRDANNIGCVISLPNIVIAPLPTEPSVSSDVVYNCDGSGNITILPNDPSFTYSIDGNAPQAGNVFNNSSVGQHTVTVNYGSECTTDIIVDVQDGNAFEASIVSYNDLDCNADGSGSITFEVDNFGVGGYEYSYDSGFVTIIGSDTASTHTISGLSAGNYTIYVRDVDDPIAGCTVTLTQTISEPTSLAVTNIPTQPTCVDDGSVIINVTGGTVAYSYEIELPDGSFTGSQNTNVFTDLNQLGNHIITVTDAHGCTGTDTFTLVAPVLPTASIDATSDVCYDSSNPGSASIVIGATGGVSPYMYKMNTGAYRASNSFANLTPGNYSFEIRDANGCTDTITFDIEPQLTANLALTKDLDCSASPNAIIELQVNGGYATYTYELEVDGGGFSAFAGTFPYSVSTPGVYRFRVTDNQGCMAVSNNITVSASVNPVATETVTEPTCFGDSNGMVEINIDPNFGASPYQISFEGSAFTNQKIYSGLAAGNYTYTVRDSKYCTYTQSVTVTDPVLFDADVVATDVSCNGSNDVPGKIDITITSGGVPNFTYTLYDNLNNLASTTSPNPINTSATTVTFDGLAFGDYYVRVLDANGCEYYENPVRVLSNPYVSVETLTQAVSCATGGSVDLLASGGSGNYTFTIFGSGDSPNNEVAGANADEEIATYTGLNPGQSYVFQVIDNGTSCSSYVQVDIDPLSGIDIVTNPTVNDVACYGDTDGSISFQFEDYDPSVTTIHYEIRESITNTPLGGAYSGTISGFTSPDQTPVETIGNIPPGDYVLFFQEGSSPDCTNTYNFRILEPNPVTLNLADQNNGYCSEDANVTVIAGGGNGSYTYAFVEDGAAPVAGDYNTNNYKELDPSVNTEWDVYVLDGNGCTTSLPLDITIADDPTPVISAIVTNQCTADEGKFTIEVSLDGEGVQPYTLSINGGSYQSSTLTTAGTTHQFNNVSSGSYSIQVRDFNGCGNTDTVEVFKPTSITVETTTLPSCAEGDGEILITAYGGSGSYEYELFNSSGVSIKGGKDFSPLFSGLDSGTYTAIVYDIFLGGCDAQVDVDLEMATPVQFSTDVTNVSCFGGSDGRIVVTLDAAMDNPPYTYQLFVRPLVGPLVPVNALPKASNIFNNLSANDDYVVRVYSGRGCFTDEDVIVSEPASIANVNANVIEFGCSAGNNPNNATVTIDTSGITGGSGTYITYEFIDSSSAVVQSGTSNVLIVTDKTGESYTINVYDDNGCSGSTTATVLPFDEMTGATAAVTTTVTCAPGSDGVITVSATSTASDTSKYEYSSDNGANYQVSNVFGGLSAGNYNFLVRHTDTGCTVTTSARLEEPNTFTIDVVKTSDVVCFGTATGEVTFELVDATYTTGFDWEIFLTDGTLVSNGSEAANGPTPIVNLGVGEYYVSITQANNPFCTNVEYFNIAGPDAAITGNTIVTDITCVPGNDGTITITDVVGGWGGYTYFVGTSVPATTDFVAGASFDTLPAGTYQAWVRDAEGCEQLIQDNIVLDVPDPIAATLQINIENCTNLQGEIEVSVPTGGQGSNYTYQLVMNTTNFRAPQNTRVFSGLGAGEYEVAITDQWGCTFTTLPVELYEQLSATTSVDKAIDCTGTPGGTITVNVTGGSANLEFIMTPPTGPAVTQSNNPTFTGLVDDGTYSFLVRDLDTTNPVCTVMVTQELAPAIQPVFTETHVDITCFGADNGSISLTQTQNGVNPLSFAISPVAGTFNASSNTFENLPPNTYSVTATGTNACVTIITDIVIDEPLAILNVNATVVEFGCSVGNNPNNATITIDGSAITGGSGTYVIYEFVDSGSNIVQSGASNVLTVTDRTGDTYTINVYDDNGCSGSTTATILSFDEMIDATAAVTTTPTCAPGNDGEITVMATSTASDNSKYEYSIDNGANYQVSNVFGGLSAGNYNFLVRHIDTGCIVTTSVRMEEPNTFTINVVKTSDVICYGTATGAVNFELVDATYPGGFTWTIYDTNGTLADTSDDIFVNSAIETTNGPSADISLEAGSYYVSITQDNNPFCTNTEAFSINGPSADISGSTVVTDITCNPGNDGSITITDVVGGWGGYTYYVGIGAPATTEFVAGASFTGLTANTYQAWVRDAEGCERLIQDTIVLDVPTAIAATLQVNQENCTNLQGEIEVSMPTGGQGSNYTYQLIMDGTNFRAPQNTRIFSGLGAGSYEVLITDQWGCSFTTLAEVLYEQMDVTASVVKSIDCTVTPGGTITVNVTGGSSNIEFVMTPPTGPNVTQTNNATFTGLTQNGTYSFLVRDLDTTNPVCQRMVSQSLDAPIAPVLLDATISNVSCFGGNDGSIRANIDPTTDGNPIYQYALYDIADLINPIAGPQSNPLFTGLIAGDYQVKVISSRSCEDVKNETITEPTQLMVTASATEFNCSPNNSVNRATVTATPGAGSGNAPYLYSINNVNYQTSNTFNIVDNGSAQAIQVYVKDANGCIEFDTVTIQPINKFTATVVQDSAITCANDETVTITVADNGLAHNYNFELLPLGNGMGTFISSTATTATFDLSAVGSYVFRVTDMDTGCYVTTENYVIDEFDFVTASATATSAVTCFGELNGSLSIDIDGYVGTYNYEVFNSSGISVIPVTAADTSVNPRSITGLSGGNYYVRITETAYPLCSEDTNVVTISSPDRPLSGVVTPVAEATCTDDRGEIRVTPQGGYKPYDIVLTNTTTGDSYTMDNIQEAIFTNLSAGDFTVRIIDNSGCVVDYTETLAPATPIVANAIPLVTDLACYGNSGATVSATVTSGGSGAYRYQLNYYDETGSTIVYTTGAQSSPTFNNLGAGIYSITVVDGWSCDTTTNTVEIRQPAKVQASLIRTDALTCETGVEFELTATGGSGTYEYSVDNVTFLPMTSNPLGLPETGILPDGTYQYYVRDAINGCEVVKSNAITENEIAPLILTVNRTAAVLNCTGESTAIIYATAEGGLGNYQYELFTDSSLTIASRVAGPQSQGVFRNLGAGTYYVTVVSDDCTTGAEEVDIIEPTPLTYTENVLDVTCAGENDGEIIVTLSGGAGGFQYAISPNLNQFFDNNTFTDLSPGEYTIIAQDLNGCFEYLTYTISEPASLAISVATTPEICVDSQDGTIILEITGGTAPYSTALNSSDVTDFVLNRTEFLDMASGEYIIVIKDANGCDTNAVVTIDRGVNLNATIEPIYECSGDIPSNYVNITLEDDSIIGDVLYAIDSVDPADLQLNPDFRNSAPGNHYITIAHANGCIQTIDFVIESFDSLTLGLEQHNMNEITAVAAGGREGYTYYFDGIDNGDSNTFYVTRTDTYEVRVVDQNGCESVANIFMEFIDIELPNFFTPDGDGQNDFWIPRNMEQFPEILIKIFDRYGRVVSEQSVDSEGWDGMYSGNELPTGDYWYVVKLNGERDEREFIGHFTLYR